MQKKRRFKKLLASTLAVIMTLSILNVLFLSMPVSAEYTYGIQYTKDDDTFYFATETKDISEGIIISPLGYFCSFYDGRNGRYYKTVFVTDRTEGRAYYNNSTSSVYKYRIPRADIDARIKAELDRATQNTIAELQENANLRIVFDSLLSIAYVSKRNLCPGITLNRTNPTCNEVLNALSVYNSKGQGNFNNCSGTNLFVYTNKNNGVSGALGTKAKNYSQLYVSSATHSTYDRKMACLGGDWDVTFSKSLYNSYYWLRSDIGDSIIQNTFSESSKANIPPGYFSIPTPPNSKVVDKIPVDLYPTSITYWTAQTGGTYVTELVEGGTYWPKFHYHNNGSIAVTAQVNAWSYPLNNWEVNNVNIVIGANSDYEIMGDYPITINNGLYYRNFGIENAQKYDTYEYNQNTIVHDWSITLTDSKATESNPNNNWTTFAHKFSPKQPDINQWIIDRENAASSWITGAVNNRIIYSGEQTNSQVKFTNISSFKLQIDEYFKSILGLNNNLLASYKKTDDPTWHNSGEVWDRETGTFRAKNTVKGTNEMLYLRASAGERSFASAMGINIDDANHITENINLNKQVFFNNQDGNDAKGNTVSVVWDNNARTLTLNGTAEASFIRTVGVSHNFKKDETYKVTIEYVSGSIKSKNNSPAACFAFDVSQNSGSGRIHADVLFPNCQELGTEDVCTSQFTLNRNEYSVSPWIWVNDGSSEKMTFNNYRVKIKIENITSFEKFNAYSTNLEGYTVIPTDLEASTISLFDAETNKRIPNGTILKAGQEVYSETTFTNHTDTSVSVELQTKHDNNSYTGYYMTDEANMANSINSVKNSNPEIDWNKDDEILTVNGSYSRNRMLSQNEVSPNKASGSSWDGKVSYALSSESPDYLTLTLNGTIYGSDYIYSSPFPNVSVLSSGIGPGSAIRLTAEYVGGSITDYNDNNLTILAFSQYHDDWSNNGNNRAFTDLWLPRTDACPGDSSTSWSFTTPYCGGSPNDYFSLGLHSRNYSTDTDSSVTFNNYTIKLKVEILNYYAPVKETVISENIPIGDFDNYLLKIKNIGGNYVGGKASLVIQYLNSNRTLVDSEEFDIPTVNETISRGISPRKGSVYYRLVLRSNTGTGDKISYNNLKLNLLLRKKSMTQCNIASDSNSIHNETCVIAPNQSITIRSDVFAISALPHNKISLSAYIYIKGLTGNTEYEYVTTNNVISKAYVIETPFKPTVVQANSEYRRGITVITSFNIKNDSYSNFGTQTDIDNIGVLSAKLKVYRTSNLTGTPIADVDCVYAVPGNGKSTLVWFEWTVPTDSPDKLYAEMVCDNNNIYSSSEFKDNGDNSKNTYCTFNIIQPKVMSTPDTTFAKKAPYWYEDGASSASVPSKATGLNLVYNQEAEQIKGSTSWSYYVANGNSLKLVTESATLMGSSVDLIPDGTLSAYVGYDNKWNIKSGYGFKIDTEFKENVHSTNVQSGYAVFPEFLYKIVDNNSSVNGYTNGAGTRVGFEGVLNKYPLCGGEYATYSTFEKTSNGKLILPNNDSSHTPTHFIPVWYPNSDYRIYCYVADCWTPGGMLSGEISSYVIHVNGNMYDDYRVSEK